MICDDELDRFVLQENEMLDQRCGDIFVTTQGNIAIQCTFCEIVYKHYKAYWKHLKREHLYLSEIEDDEVLLEEIEILNTDEFLSESSIKYESEFIIAGQLPEPEPEEVLMSEDEKREHQDANYEREIAIKSLSTEINENRCVTNINKLEEPPEEHKCPICGSGFKQKRYLACHLKRHSLRKNQELTECEEKLHTAAEVRTFADIKSFKCKSFPNKEPLQRRMHSHSDQYIESVETSKLSENEEKEKFKSSKKEDSTKQLQNTPQVIRSVKKRNSSNPSKIAPEDRKHKCPICALGFKAKRSMMYHLKRHSNQKDHVCPDCGKMFYTRTEVQTHRQFHSSVRSFLCDDCGRAFLTKNQLKDHTKRHNNQRDFKCKTCDKAFFDNKTLQSHIPVHTSERPFKCKTCNATFTHRTTLRNHVKLHENKREYKCNLCDAEYNQYIGLLTHIRNHHKTSKIV